MKKTFALILSCALLLTFAACAAAEGTLIVYFSATNNTEAVANVIAAQTGGVLHELLPVTPYTDNDLDWTNPESRVCIEHENPDAQNVELQNPVPENWDSYDTVFVGYPIWWHNASWVLNMFIASNDFTGKTVIPFCTSSASDLGESAANLAQIAGEGNWLEGVRFSSAVGEDQVVEWLSGLELSAQDGMIAADGASGSTVYFTSDISADGMLSVYQALGWEPTGKVAVKLSTGEPPASNYLRPELIQKTVEAVDGTIVECNTAYGGSRSETAMHYQVAEDHGFTAIADFQILDENGSMSLPVAGGTVLTENYVGAAFADYDSYLILSHFKGHAMAGFGGAIKNISIGLGSSQGKCWIHSGGSSRTSPWGGSQDAFLEAMAEAGKSVSDYLGHGDRIAYINVMNRLSVDCDCDGNPAEPDMHDIGILASVDPVALDQACIDLVYEQKEGDGASLVGRIESRNGLHTLEHGEEIGLGSRTYKLVNIND